VTTVSLTPKPLSPVPLPAAAARPQPRGILFEVEFRKMLDTRAGLAPCVATLVASVVVVGVDLAHLPHRTVVLRTLILDAGMPPAVFLPALAVLAMTAEWSQRTGLVTFTLSPWRNRVLAAKAGAALILGALATGAALLLAVAAAVCTGMFTGHTDYGGAGAATVAAFGEAGTAMLLAVACGALAPSIPMALAACYLAPAVCGAMLAGVGGWAEWVDITRALDRIARLKVAGAIPQTSVAVGLWVVLPLVAGLVVGARREVR
jgi:hypothetical protein